MSEEAGVLGQLAREERQHCMRALLQMPLLYADPAQRDVLRLVHRHREWLQRWFNDKPGWRLAVEAEFARLYKTPASVDDATYPAIDSRRIPFSRRRYVLLCLVLAALEKADRQTVLGQIAEQVAMMACGDALLADQGHDVRFERRDERMDLVAVIRLLLRHGVLLRIHGDEEGYLQQSGDVLYTINRPALARMLSTQRGPSMLNDGAQHERLEWLHQDEALTAGEAAKRRHLSMVLIRKLLDQPVLYYAELIGQERSYLDSQRARLTHAIEDATGLVPEIREEGIAMVDPQGRLTDHGMPDEGTDGHAALLLSEYLVSRLKREEVPVPVLRLEQYLAKQAKEHKSHWRNAVQEPAGVRHLLETVLTRLNALSLIRRTPDAVIPLPALGRYRLAGPRHQTLHS